MLGEENIKMQLASGICDFCPKALKINVISFKEEAQFRSPDSNFIV